MKRAFVAVALLLLLISCGGADDDAAVPARQITVLAASPLADALTELGRAFEKTNGVTVALTFASSSALVEQVNRGAACDVVATDETSYAEIRDASGPTMIGRDGTAGYVMGVLTSTESFAEAQEWLEFVAGPDGQRVMAEHGLSPPE